MKVSVLQEQFKVALAKVVKTVNTKAYQPILENVYLKAEEGRLMIGVTDLEKTAIVYIGATVQKEGRCTLPAKVLSELVANYNKERVDITWDETDRQATIRCHLNQNKLKGETAAEYPNMDREPGTLVFTLTREQFIDAAKFVMTSAAKKDYRQILTCVDISIEPGPKLTFAAADGFRLAVAEFTDFDCELEVKEGYIQEYNVPKASLERAKELVELSTKGSEVRFYHNHETGAYAFASESALLVTQTVDGRFPDWRSIVNVDYTISLRIDPKDMEKQVKRAMIFAKDNNNSVKMRVGTRETRGDVLEVRGVSNDRGEVKSELPVECITMSGFETEFAANGGYLKDTMSVIQGPAIMNFLKSSSPIIIHDGKRPGWKHLIMPMSVNRYRVEEPEEEVEDEEEVYA
jgi:DNA polymerase III subunit beta